MGAIKHYNFTLFFNYNFEGKHGMVSREWAEGKRDEALVYLKRLFDSKARFGCVAKDSGSARLMLRGYVNLHSPCTQPYFKRLLGKFSCCKPSYFGDMVSLCRLLHVDRNLAVTGGLPRNGCVSAKLKSFAGDPKFIIKILLEAMDRKDVD